MYQGLIPRRSGRCIQGYYIICVVTQFCFGKSRSYCTPGPGGCIYTQMNFEWSWPLLMKGKSWAEPSQLGNFQGTYCPTYPAASSPLGSSSCVLLWSVRRFRRHLWATCQVCVNPWQVQSCWAGWCLWLQWKALATNLSWCDSIESTLSHSPTVKCPRPNFPAAVELLSSLGCSFVLGIVSYCDLNNTSWPSGGAPSHLTNTNGSKRGFVPFMACF